MYVFIKDLECKWKNEWAIYEASISKDMEKNGLFVISKVIKIKGNWTKCEFSNIFCCRIEDRKRFKLTWYKTKEKLLRYHFADLLKE